MGTGQGKKFTVKRREEFWKCLESVFNLGKRSKNVNKYQYFDFIYAGLNLRVDVYVKEQCAIKYGGVVLVSFNTETFKNSGIYKSNGRTPIVNMNSVDKRIFFSKKIDLCESNNWNEAITWIRSVVMNIVFLNKVVSETI